MITGGRTYDIGIGNKLLVVTPRIQSMKEKKRMSWR